jgi:sec-independent protein translocase protein TatC
MDDSHAGGPPPDDSQHSYPEDPYGGHQPAVVVPATVTSGGGSGTPPPPTPPSDEDPDDEGMLRMSFMEHLEELRSRLIRCLWGLGVAFLVAISFSSQLWDIIRQPAAVALKTLGLPPDLYAMDPTEGISIIWFKLPLVVSLFLAAPWVLYQFWAFISPGLYKREKKWAAPFVISSALLFIGGGLFAYFIAFRYGLTFLLGIGLGQGLKAIPNVTQYFDLFVNVTLGVAVIFELPVLLFLLTLLRIASPSFLMNHSRYAILAIVILAAVITPTPDVFNLTLFAVPMILLYFLGVFASFLLVMRREKRAFPWRMFSYWLIAAAAVLAIAWAVVARWR